MAPAFPASAAAIRWAASASLLHHTLFLVPPKGWNLALSSMALAALFRRSGAAYGFSGRPCQAEVPVFDGGFRSDTRLVLFDQMCRDESQ